ncbi:MAG: hydrogenase maturation nickel metallochaperone HypA [Actinomycetota bacterium]
MHESRLVTDILSAIEKVAETNDADYVEAVRIEIGALSHVTPDGFAGHFTMASRGTVAEAARLDITKSEDLDARDALDVRLVSIVTGGQ